MRRRVGRASSVAVHDRAQIHGGNLEPSTAEHELGRSFNNGQKEKNTVRDGSRHAEDEYLDGCAQSVEGRRAEKARVEGEKGKIRKKRKKLR